MRQRLALVALALVSSPALAMPEVAGSGPNDLQVSANTGAARLPVPIPLPLGTGGFAPELVLEYSSHAGDGPFGVGWHLRLPEIRRTARFGVPAWNDAVDRFELADELLVSAGGGRYHPQTETFQRVMKVGGTWEVTETDGTVATYGGTSASRVVHQPSAQVARWLLSEIEDANGNQIKFIWDKDTLGEVGHPYLTAVRWTYRGGALLGEKREVEFVYETRPDPIHAFPGGLETRISRRVKEVVVKIGGSAFRRLVPTYSTTTAGYATHRTRLASIQIFGSDCNTAGGSGCTGLPLQTFTYTDPSDELADVSSEWVTPASGQFIAPIPFEEQGDYNTARDLGVRLADLNGDGRADIVRAYHDANGSYIHDVWMNTGSDWENTSTQATNFKTSLTQLTFASLKLANKSDWVDDVPRKLAFARKDGWARGATSNPYIPPVPLRIADLDGDGRADLAASIRFWGLDEQTPTTEYAAVWINNGAGWTAGNATGLLAFEGYAVRPMGPYPGSGVCVYNEPPTSCGRSLVRLDEGVLLGDVNGDRHLDLVGKRDWLAQFVPGQPYYSYHTKTSVRYNDARIQLANGGWGPAPQYAPPAAVVGPHCAENLNESFDYGARLVDVNGDGLVDFVKTAAMWEYPDDPTSGCYLGAYDPPTSAGDEGVWINTGHGWCDPQTQCVDAQRWQPPLLDLGYSPAPRLAFTQASGSSYDNALMSSELVYTDLNGDGYPDLLTTDGAGTVYRNAWLFDPSGAPGAAWISDTRFRPAAGFETTGLDSGSNLKSMGVRLADVDGDGIVDFVKSFGGTKGTALSQFAFADRLSSMDNGRGGTAEVTYASAIEQRDSELDDDAEEDMNETDAGIELWSALPVVTDVEVHDVHDGDTFVTSYAYAHPRFCPMWNSGVGFRLVDVVRPDDSRRRTFYWQRHGRAGQPSQEEVLDPSGVALWERTSTWDVVDGATVTGSTSGALVGRLTAQVEGNLYGATPGATRTSSFSYGAYNFVTQAVVTRPSGGLTITRTPDHDTGNWIIGRVASEVRAHAGITYASETRTYVLGTPLLASRSRLMQPRTGGGSSTNAIESWSYDAFGNRRSYTDAGGRTERYCYDGDSQFSDGSGCAGGGGGTHTVLTAVKDRLDEVTSFEADLATGTRTRETRWSDDVSEWTLDRFGRQITLDVTPAGESEIPIWERFYFDGGPGPGERASRILLRATGDGSVVRTAEYLDGFGQVVRQVRDAPPGSTTPAIGVALDHDHAGRVVLQSYDQACGGLDCAAIQPGAQPGIALSYDGLGRPLVRTAPDGIEAFGYGAEARTPPAGPGSGGAFDVVMAKDGRGNLVRRLQDGDRVSWVEECLTTVLPSATSPGTNCGSPDVTFYAFESTGEIGAIYDAMATSGQGYQTARHRLVYRFDTLGNVLTIEDPDGGVSQHSYNLTGTLLSRTNARGQLTSYVYDELDRIVTVDRPSPETDATVTYDTRTRQRASVEEIGSYLLEMDYDALGRRSRLEQTLYGGNFGSGFLLMAEWEHDLLDRPTAIEYPEAGTRVAYEYAGAYLTAVCEDPSASGCASAPSHLQYVTGVTYDALGRRTLVDGPPGDLALSYSTATHRLSGQWLTRTNGDRPLDMAYTWDAVGNLGTVTDSHTPASGLSSTASFGYDNRNRLAWRTLNAETRHFQFDKLGNLTGRDLASGGGAPNQLYDHLQKPHAITTSANGAAWAYDADGNVTRRGSSYLTFDSQNRLLCEGPSPGCGSADVEFGYDLDGRRLWQRTSSQTVALFEDLADWDKTQTDAALHVHAFGLRIASKSMTSPARRLAAASVPGLPWPLDPGWLLLAVAGGGALWLGVLAVRDGVPARIRRRPAPAAVAALAAASLALPPRAWAGGDPNPGNTFRRFLFHDQLGTNVLVTNPNGNPVRRRVFEPFGKVIVEAGTEAPQRLFTGQRYEPESQLYDFRARWYDPEAGRFLSVDPVMQDAWDPQVFNGYSYVRNNPVSRWDPNGETSFGFTLSLGSFTIHGTVYVADFNEIVVKIDSVGGASLAILNLPSFSFGGIGPTGGGFNPGGPPGNDSDDPLSDGDQYGDSGVQLAQFRPPPRPPTRPPQRGRASTRRSGGVRGEAVLGEYPSRSEAWREAKEVGGIPRHRQPDLTRRVRLEDQPGNVETIEFVFRRPDGATVTIRDDFLGHAKGREPPHFNVEVRLGDGSVQSLPGRGHVRYQ